MSQGRVRGRGRGYRNFVRNDTQNLRPMDQFDNKAKTNRNISHNNNCCQQIITNFELDENGAVFFQELKNLWNMCKCDQLSWKYYSKCCGCCCTIFM